MEVSPESQAVALEIADRVQQGNKPINTCGNVAGWRMSAAIHEQDVGFPNLNAKYPICGTSINAHTSSLHDRRGRSLDYRLWKFGTKNGADASWIQSAPAGRRRVHRCGQHGYYGRCRLWLPEVRSTVLLVLLRHMK